MFGLRIAKTEEKKKTIPWLTLGWIALLVLLYGWCQWGFSSKTSAVAAAKEKLICFYLKHDYTLVPDNVQKHLPQAVQKHAQRVRSYVEHYYRSGMARDQARQWLSEGDWTRYNISQPPRGMSCLQYATRQGQLSHHPKKRLFMSMASLDPNTLQSYQQELQKLGQVYLTTRQDHPWYGWGLVPADKSPLTWVTSNTITPAWYTLFWQVLMLWLIAGFLEQAWGGPVWLGIYWLGGILGNMLLMLLLSGSKQPILGGSLALATVMGMWGYATYMRPIQVWSQKWWPQDKAPVLPSWAIVAGWFGLSLFDTLLHGYPIVAHATVQLLCFAMGAGTIALLQHMEWLDTLPMPLVEKAQQPAPQQQQRTRTQMRTFQKTQTGPKARSLYLKPDLKQMVKQTYQQGQYQEAVEMYRELYKTGQARLEDFDELFIACEKGNIVPKPDDFLRAIRAASFARNLDKARAYYHRCDSKRAVMPWSMREQISLAQELKRAGMFQDALQELDTILDEGPDGVFFMDALILKIETLLTEAEDLESAAQLVYQAELYLQQNPTHEESVTRLRIMLAEADGSSVPEIRTIPKGLGPEALDADAQAEDQIDEGLLIDLDLFEKKLAGDDEVPSASSWDELPSLLLRDKPRKKFLDEPAAAPLSDEDFLFGGEDFSAEDFSAQESDFPVEESESADHHKALATTPNTEDAEEFAYLDELTDAPLTNLYYRPEPLSPQTPEPAPSQSVNLSLQQEHTPSIPSTMSFGSQEDMTLLDPDMVNHLLGNYASTPPPATRLEPEIAPPQPEQHLVTSATPWDSSWDLPPVSPSMGQDGLREASSDAFLSTPTMTSRGGNETAMVNSYALLQEGAVDPSQFFDTHQQPSAIPYHTPAPTSLSSDWPSQTAADYALSSPHITPYPPSDPAQKPVSYETLHGLVDEAMEQGFDLPLFGGEENLQATRIMPPLHMDDPNRTTFAELQHAPVESLQGARPVVLQPQTPTPYSYTEYPSQPPTRPNTYHPSSDSASIFGLTEQGKDEDNNNR